RLEKRRAAAEKKRLGQQVRRLAREQAARKREQEQSARAAASNEAPRRGSAPSPPAWDERAVRRARGRAGVGERQEAGFEAAILLSFARSVRGSRLFECRADRGGRSRRAS